MSAPTSREASLRAVLRDSQRAVLVAPTGYGKTRLLLRLAREPGARLVSLRPDRQHEDPRVAARPPATVPDLFATLLARPDLRCLVVDDAHLLPPGSSGAELLAAGPRGGPAVLLAGRPPLGGGLSALAVAGAARLGVDDLALRGTELESYLVRRLGPRAADHAEEVDRLAAGWPVLVRLVAERMARGDLATWRDALQECASPGGPVDRFVAERVLGEVPPAERWAMRVLAHIGPTARPVVAAALGPDGDLVLRRVVERGVCRPIGEEVVLHPAVRSAVRVVWPLAAAEVSRALREAADRLDDDGPPALVVEALRRSGDLAALASSLRRRGEELLAKGEAEAVVAGVRSLPEHLRTPDLVMLLGQALQVRGDWEGALSSYASLAGRGPTIPAALAWRMGVIYYLRGEPRLADVCYERGLLGREETADEARLLGWMASSAWMTGDAERCGDLAARSHAAALRCGDRGALATAHTAVALHAGLVGDRRGNDAHYTRALDYAEQAGDVLLIVRVRANRAAHHLEEGRYEEALREAAPAMSAAHAAGFASFEALCRVNAAEALVHLGHLDEAVEALSAARDLYQGMGSRKVAYALNGLGDIHRARGSRELAVAAYGEALAAADGSDDMQALAPALAGLARVLAPAEPGRARDLAERADALPAGGYSATVQLALGWVVLPVEPERAAHIARQAAEQARTRRDWAALAESLELQAASAARRDGARSAVQGLLAEALTVWTQTGDALAGGRVRVALGRVSSAAQASVQAAAHEAERTLLRAGIAVHGPSADGILGAIGSGAPGDLAVATLGGLRVERDGREVDGSAWQSRKARDLLKILVSRRGRPIPRDQLADLLWPDDRRDGVGNRLAVAAATLRRVLDPDRRHPADHVVVGGEDTMALDLRHLRLDVEGFLADARAGLRLLREGDVELGEHAVRSAVDAYAGPFLPENAYDDWAAAVREETLDTYLECRRALVRLCRERGDTDGWVAHARAALATDPYEEWAHRALVAGLQASGRHGAAARAEDSYRARMADLELPGRAADPAPGNRREQVATSAKRR